MSLPPPRRRPPEVRLDPVPVPPDRGRDDFGRGGASRAPTPAEAPPADPDAAAQLSRGRAAATMAPPVRPRDPLGQDRALERGFLAGQHVYSRNFGVVDPDHVRHNFGAYVDTYRAAEIAARTGRPQQVTLTYGSGMTEHRMTYTVQPPRDADPETLHRVTRGIVSDASVRYEDHTRVAGGLGNRAAEGVGRGSSAFSTEDLSSNGLGMMAAEDHIRRNGSTLRPEDRERASEGALRLVLERSGGIAARDPSGQVTERGDGNHRFTPVRSTAIRVDPGADAYLARLEREHQAAGDMPGAGPGWRLERAEGSFAGNLVRDHVTTPVSGWLGL